MGLSRCCLIPFFYPAYQEKHKSNMDKEYYYRPFYNIEEYRCYRNNNHTVE